MVIISLFFAVNFSYQIFIQEAMPIKSYPLWKPLSLRKSILCFTMLSIFFEWSLTFAKPDYRSQLLSKSYTKMFVCVNYTFEIKPKTTYDSFPWYFSSEANNSLSIRSKTLRKVLSSEFSSNFYIILCSDMAKEGLSHKTPWIFLKNTA